MESNTVLGLSYPFGNSNNASFGYTYDTFSNERSKLINFLRTKQYERPMNPLFGLGLESYLFEPNTEELEMRIRDEIFKKIAAWLPAIIINDLVVNVSSNYDRNYIEITIKFSVKNIPEYYDIINLRY